MGPVPEEVVAKEEPAPEEVVAKDEPVSEEVVATEEPVSEGVVPEPVSGPMSMPTDPLKMTARLAEGMMNALSSPIASQASSDMATVGRVCVELHLSDAHPCPNPAMPPNLKSSPSPANTKTQSYMCVYIYIYI